MIDASNPLAFLVFALALSLLFSELAFRLKFSRVFGQIVAGIVIAMILANPPDILTYFAQLGIVFLLLLTGLEMDLKKLVKNSKDIVSVGLLNAIVPFILGFVVTLFVLPKLLPIENPLVTAFVVGATLAITAEATSTKLLIDRKLINTKLGQVMIGSATVDNVFEILFLVIVLMIAHKHLAEQSVQQSSTFALFAIITIVLVIALLKLIPRFVDYFVRERAEESVFALTVICGLAIAIMTEQLYLGTILGALIAGALIQVSVDRKTEKRIAENLRIFSMGLIVPFFFIQMGYDFKPEVMFQLPVVVGIILLIAWAGKMGAALLAKPLTDLTTRQLILVGWAMNSRGVVELVIAKIALEGNLISQELFSAILFMTFITTAAFPIAMEYYLRRYPHIMEENEEEKLTVA
jgi:Kef-type K+ transport system membrane component KefB